MFRCSSVIRRKLRSAIFLLRRSRQRQECEMRTSKWNGTIRVLSERCALPRRIHKERGSTKGILCAPYLPPFSRMKTGYRLFCFLSFRLLVRCVDTMALAYLTRRRAPFVSYTRKRQKQIGGRRLSLCNEFSLELQIFHGRRVFVCWMDFIMIFLICKPF